MKRPSIENYFPKDFGIDKINNVFLKNEGLYRYIQALDNYIDEFEEKPQLTKDEVESIGYVENTTINGKIYPIFYKGIWDGEKGVFNDGKLIVRKREYMFPLSQQRPQLTDIDFIGSILEKTLRGNDKYFVEFESKEDNENFILDIITNFKKQLQDE